MARSKKDESQEARTVRNRARRAKQADLRTARLIGRTQRLVGTHVQVRTKGLDRPLVGTVLEVLSADAPDAPRNRGAIRRSGSQLRIRTNAGELVKSRHRVKPLKD